MRRDRGRCATNGERVAREVITESFLVLSFPGRVLALGTHLADEYPDVLRRPADVELTELVAQFQASPTRARQLRRGRLVDLHQRMHYIVHLFCAFHLDEELYRQPRLHPGAGGVLQRRSRASWRAVTRLDGQEAVKPVQPPGCAGLSTQTKSLRYDARVGVGRASEPLDVKMASSPDPPPADGDVRRPRFAAVEHHVPDLVRRRDSSAEVVRIQRAGVAVAIVETRPFGSGTGTSLSSLAQ